MRTRMAWLTALAVATGGGVFVFAQAPTPAPPAPPAAPAAAPQPAAKPAGRDPARFSPLHKQFFFSAQRGADWLQRCNRPDGRFGYVSTPALRLRNDNDHYLRQAGAVCALARAARLFGDERAAACATRALLTLLLATAPDDPKAPQVRYTTVPSTAVNRLASAGLLAQAVYELPAPAEDLLTQAEQLCNYVRSRQKADGSLGAADGPEAAAAGETPEAADAFAAEALYALARGMHVRPAPWKAEALRKALAYYQPRWRARKALAAAPRLAGAWAEAYLATEERPFADAVVEIGDWLLGLQYQQPDPERLGGFMGWTDGRPAPRPPEVDTARLVEALAEGCRVARRTGDARRHPRYKEAVERGLLFVATLQYTAGNTQHFAEWYQREIVGAFHASHQDGNLRLDYTQQAVGGLVHYLSHVAELP